MGERGGRRKRRGRVERLKWRCERERVEEGGKRLGREAEHGGGNQGWGLRKKELEGGRECWGERGRCVEREEVGGGWRKGRAGVALGCTR